MLLTVEHLYLHFSDGIHIAMENGKSHGLWIDGFPVKHGDVPVRKVFNTPGNHHVAKP